MLYHLHLSYWEAMTIDTYLRKWMIEKYIDQKEKEHEAMERESRKNR